MFPLLLSFLPLFLLALFSFFKLLLSLPLQRLLSLRLVLGLILQRLQCLQKCFFPVVVEHFTHLDELPRVVPFLISR